MKAKAAFYLCEVKDKENIKNELI